MKEKQSEQKPGTMLFLAAVIFPVLAVMDGNYSYAVPVASGVLCLAGLLANHYGSKRSDDK
jgi:hypothetical protein